MKALNVVGGILFIILGVMSGLFGYEIPSWFTTFLCFLVAAYDLISAMKEEP